MVSRRSLSVLGGCLYTIAEGVNGTFFDESTADAIRTAVIASRGTVWEPQVLRAHVDAFSPERFAKRLQEVATRMER